jgi:hypothetical protein
LHTTGNEKWQAKGMTNKTKAATRTLEMKAYLWPKEDVDALMAYPAAMKSEVAA